MPDVDGASVHSGVSPKEASAKRRQPLITYTRQPDPGYARGFEALLRPRSLEPVDRTLSCLRTKPSLHEMQGEVDS